MMLAALLLLAQTGATVFEAADVPDEVLATQRGGIRLPNGIDATWSVNTTTAVNGAVVLQTIVRADQGGLQVSAYAPGDGQRVAGPDAQSPASSGAEPRVTYDSRTGISVRQAPATGISVSSGPSGDAGHALAGLEQVDASHAATTANGVIRQVNFGNSPAIELQGQDLQVLHLAGNALGTAILNSGSDRTIDTQTTVSLDLSNAGPDVLGSTFLRIENIAVDALSSRF